MAFLLKMEQEMILQKPTSPWKDLMDQKLKRRKLVGGKSTTTEGFNKRYSAHETTSQEGFTETGHCGPIEHREEKVAVRSRQKERRRRR